MVTVTRIYILGKEKQKTVPILRKRNQAHKYYITIKAKLPGR